MNVFAAAFLFLGWYVVYPSHFPVAPYYFLPHVILAFICFLICAVNALLAPKNGRPFISIALIGLSVISTVIVVVYFYPNMVELRHIKLQEAANKVESKKQTDELDLEHKIGAVAATAVQKLIDGDAQGFKDAWLPQALSSDPAINQKISGEWLSFVKGGKVSTDLFSQPGTTNSTWKRTSWDVIQDIDPSYDKNGVNTNEGTRYYFAQMVQEGDRYLIADFRVGKN